MKVFVRIVLYILAAAACYYGITIASIRSGSKFFLFWEALGAGLIILALALKFELFSKVPQGVKITICVVLLAGIILLISLLFLIFSNYNKKPQKNVEYLIVLGAQVKNNGPSVVLTYRLEAALEYLKENPECKCLVSGGQGSNEPCSEAEAMKKYLVAGGIAEDRIICEDKSTDTSENLRFSAKLIPQGATVAIVTNNFHMCRGLYLAKRYGFENAEGLAAKSTLYFMPNNVLREVIGLVKDFLIRVKD